MRIAVRALFRAWQSELCQQRDGFTPRRAPRHRIVQPDRLPDLAADRIDRIERRHRLLEDYRNVVAAERPHPPFRDRKQVDRVAVFRLERRTAADIDVVAAPKEAD